MTRRKQTKTGVRRTRVISLRVSEDEARELAGLAEQRGVTLSRFLIEAARQAGDIDKARELQNFAQDVINVICHFRGNIVGGKRIMKLIGLDLGKNRTPFQNMTDEEETRMKAELEAIDFFNRCNIF